MFLKGDRLYLAIDTTPDYQSVVGVASEKEQAERMLQEEGRLYNPGVIEVDLGRLADFLLKEGIASLE